MRKALMTVVSLIVLAGILYGGYQGFRLVQARKEAQKAAAVKQAVRGPMKVAVTTVRTGRIAHNASGSPARSEPWTPWTWSRRSAAGSSACGCPTAH